MSRIVQPSTQDITDWQAWVAKLPPTARAVAEQLDPWTLYLLSSSNQYVVLQGINEDGTISVGVLPAFNLLVIVPYIVFGVTLEMLSDVPASRTAALEIMQSTNSTMH